MKKNAILSVIVLAVVVMMSACKSKPAGNTNAEQQESTTTAALTPEGLISLVNAEWDAVPQDLLDSMGVKVLNTFKKEEKEAQVDNLQYYYGRGASVELDNEGQPVKITADSENAIVIYLTAESVAYGVIAFRSEADYNEFMKKANAFSEKAGEEPEMEFTGNGKNTEDDNPGYEKDKWFFVDFTSNK
ncbi:MAG: hypothetical protein IJK46_12850 [Prevotella sp.]|nr:hypothetical protein [Prevotella sp.]